MTTVTVNNAQRSNLIEVSRLGSFPLLCSRVGIIALVLALALTYLTASDIGHLMHAYLLSVCFFTSIGLGSLFFVILQHLTGARWSVVIRRLAELLTTTLPTLGLLMLPVIVPILLGNAQLYVWNDAALRETDILIRGKAAYLNAPFFAVRCVGYFAVWTLLAKFYLRNSTQLETSQASEAFVRMRRWSGPSMIAFAGTVNFAAFDWIMSLDPHWFSTIFGIYFFAGCAVAVFATLILVAAPLQKYGYVSQQITTEHYHDLGKLLFGFMFFWAYIAFSQYLLIWYANIPEETVWFLHRQQHGWEFVGLLLVVGHFLIPFFGLMSRHVRRNRGMLVFWSIFLLILHWIDLFWLIMPSASPDIVPLGFAELLCFVGVGGIWLAALLRKTAGHQLIPTGDPNLIESLAFHNV